MIHQKKISQVSVVFEITSQMEPDHSFVIELSKETIYGLRETWKELGVEEKEQEAKLNELMDEVRNVYESKLAAAREWKEKCQVDLTNRMAEIEVISTHMGETKPNVGICIATHYFAYIFLMIH